MLCLLSQGHVNCYRVIKATECDVPYVVQQMALPLEKRLHFQFNNPVLIDMRTTEKVTIASLRGKPRAIACTAALTPFVHREHLPLFNVQFSILSMHHPDFSNNSLREWRRLPIDVLLESARIYYAPSATHELEMQKLLADELRLEIAARKSVKLRTLKLKDIYLPMVLLSASFVFPLLEYAGNGLMVYEWTKSAVDSEARRRTVEPSVIQIEHLERIFGLRGLVVGDEIHLLMGMARGGKLEWAIATQRVTLEVAIAKFSPRGAYRGGAQVTPKAPSDKHRYSPLSLAWALCPCARLDECECEDDPVALSAKYGQQSWAARVCTMCGLSA